MNSPGSTRPSSNDRPTQHAFSLRAPVPVTGPYRPESEQRPSRLIFMPRTRARTRVGPDTSALPRVSRRVPVLGRRCRGSSQATAWANLTAAPPFAQERKSGPIHHEWSEGWGAVGAAVATDPGVDNLSMSSVNVDLVRSIYAAWELAAIRTARTLPSLDIAGPTQAWPAGFLCPTPQPDRCDAARLSGGALLTPASDRRQPGGEPRSRPLGGGLRCQKPGGVPRSRPPGGGFRCPMPGGAPR